MGCINSKEETRDKDCVMDVKILLLGAGESGKSTVLKQLKMIHRMELSEEDYKLYKQTLHSNTIESMQAFIEASKKFGYNFTPEESELAKKVTEMDVRSTLTEESAKAIQTLWQSDAIKKTCKDRNKFWNLDCSDFYFDNVLRFVEPDFKPSEDDCILARIRTTGVSMTDFDDPPFRLHVQDVGGQRSERKKWKECFENVRAVVYVVNLVAVNRVLFEDPSSNRMKECVELFEQIANNPLFNKVPIFLFLNKKDLFEKMLQEGNSITSFYNSYEGPNETNACIEFIKEDFLNRVQPDLRKKVHIFSVAARYRPDIKYAFDEIRKIMASFFKEEIKSAKTNSPTTDQ
jgi:GTPase SAR1 family protein